MRVVPYDPSWIDLYMTEAALLTPTLGENFMEIHHIGSTAIPNMASKPVIDIMIVVKDINLVDSKNDAMASLDYVARGECGIPMRRFFRKGGNERTHHVHVYQEGSPHIADHLKFRDHMRGNPQSAQEYMALKESLSKKYLYEREHYTNGKNDFIQRILKKEEN